MGNASGACAAAAVAVAHLKQQEKPRERLDEVVDLFGFLVFMCNHEQRCCDENGAGCCTGDALLRFGACSSGSPSGLSFARKVAKISTLGSRSFEIVCLRRDRGASCSTNECFGRQVLRVSAGHSVKCRMFRAVEVI
eukprot:TRINITY_DN29977_c0_g1_i1.p1 TRINITY_DN29977_c0_g1~~TRINITY_DN29977_c0_g1_i1.p1  ORF type:complete len:137 (-),score=14.10 TRINITY_DN29977_c0_g1_i1:106-516(-)